VLGLAVLASLSVLPAGTGRAEPRPSLAEVQRQVEALNQKVDVAVEDYASAKIALSAAARSNAVAMGRVRAAEQQLATIRRSMSGLAAAAYKSGGSDQLIQLVNNSTPQTFLDRASSLDRIAASQGAQLAAAATARHRLDTARDLANRQQVAQAAVAKTLAQHRAKIESVLATQERLLGSLRADERRQLAAARAADARRTAALRASRVRVSTDQPLDRPTYNGPASGRASIAVQEAYRKLGSPYKWAAAGPDRFDCSGLTMWVWAKAGVSLPHSSKAQYAGGRKVARSSLQPGDLVFFGSPIHHVAIYVGGGQMISAPQTGEFVKLRSANRPDYVGAVRP